MVASPPRLEILSGWLPEAMERHGVPGLAVGLVHEGREETLCLGVTSLENPLPVTPDTLFRVGSITKTLTATALMRLVEAGGLDLDGPVRPHLPELRPKDEEAGRLTLRHLLTHTGGWLDDDRFPDTGEGDDALTRMVAALADQPRIAGAGEVSSYGDSHFIAAGRLLEAVAGRPYEAAARALVLGPLGMDASTFFPAEAMTRRFAAGHHRPGGEGPPIVTRPWALPRGTRPASGLVSSLAELLGYARFHMGDGAGPDGTCILSKETAALMRTPLILGALEHWRGLAWNVRDLGGVRFVGHAGATSGQHAQLLLAPGRCFALCVLANAAGGLGLVTGLVDRVREGWLGVVKDEPAPLSPPPEALAPLAGRYGMTGGRALEVAAGEGRLVLRFVWPDRPPGLPPLPPATAAMYDERCFVIEDGRLQGKRGEFVRDGAGRVGWLRWAGRALPRQG